MQLTDLHHAKMVSSIQLAKRDKGGQSLKQISHLYYKAKLSVIFIKQQIAVCTETYSQIPVYADEVTPN
jgi:hypothetical protein